jgi:hypothetical protein
VRRLHGPGGAARRRQVCTEERHGPVC